MRTVLAFMLVATAAAAAHAARFADDRGFALDLDVDTTKYVVCPMLPPPKLPDLRCAGLPPVPPAPPGDSGVSIIAISAVRAFDHGFVVTLLRQSPLEANGLTDKALDDTVAGAAAGMRSTSSLPVRPRTTNGRTWKRIQLGAAPALEYTFELGEPNAVQEVAMMWALYGERGTYVVTVISPVAHEAAVRALSESALRKVQLTPASAKRRAEAEGDSDYERGRRLGLLVGRAVPFAGALLVGVWLLLRRVRRG